MSMIQTHNGESVTVAPTIAVGADIDYGFDWSDWLKDGDSIVTSTWVASDDSLTIGASNIGGAVTSVMLSTAVLGVKYKVSNTVTASPSGLVDVRSMWIKCASK